MRKMVSFSLGFMLVTLTCALVSAQDNPPIEFVTTWNVIGQPHYVEVDAAGNVYVPADNRIQIFDNTGTFLTSWGSEGSGEGQLLTPYDIAIAGDGSVYVAEFGNGRVQKFDSDGNFVLMWGIGVASGGDTFEVCTGHCQAGTRGGYQGIAVSPSGDVYAIPHGDIPYVFDSTGNILGSIGSQGTGDGQFYFPNGIAFDTSGNLFVVDANNNRVQKFDSNGDFVSKWGLLGTAEGDFDHPWGLAVDLSGAVYVADNVNRRIQKFDNDGNFLYAFGIGVATGSAVFEVCTEGCGQGLNEYQGGFHFPHGIAVDDDGNVFVAENLLHRIQKFSPTSEPWSCFGFQPPMNSGTVTARGSRALPLKAKLFDSEGNEVTDLDLSAPPVLQVVFQPASGGDPLDVTDDALPAGFGTEGNEFEYNFADHVWQFNLKTKDYTAAGTYAITMVSGDVVEYAIDPACEAAFERGN